MSGPAHATDEEDGKMTTEATEFDGTEHVAGLAAYLTAMLAHLDPAARRVHPRRRHAYVDAGGFGEGVRSGVVHRGAFELRYGVPTDVDTVWRDRDELQDGRK